MQTWWPVLVLVGLVALLLVLSRRPAGERLFRWLPIPLWCYLTPMILRAAGWLPVTKAVCVGITDQLLPVAMGLLLLGLDIAALRRIGSQAIIAMLVGTVSIVLGGPLLLFAFRSQLPPEAWKSVGTLAATWTGGSLNMLAIQTILDVPDAAFAPLVVVDAVVAYGWMACLISCRALAASINRWLGASATQTERRVPDVESGVPWRRQASLRAAALAVWLAWFCRGLARLLPIGRMVASTTGWVILLVTSMALVLSCMPAVRRVGRHGAAIGYPCLYVVLASLGAQASLSALAATPVWLLLGLSWLVVHAVALLAAGRIFRLPVGVLATASQANVGGVVSAPLVGAVYDQALAPVGLILAVLGNALGTYLGLFSALLVHLLNLC
ncbi:MAG: DUF819 family protein [Candidatus Omnitrophica bacterium]|nr:DUF819 family protein [Candidatus Omnitrophota bacterium]